MYLYIYVNIYCALEKNHYTHYMSDSQYIEKRYLIEKVASEEFDKATKFSDSERLRIIDTCKKRIYDFFAEMKEHEQYEYSKQEKLPKYVQ